MSYFYRMESCHSNVSTVNEISKRISSTVATSRPQDVRHRKSSLSPSSSSSSGQRGHFRKSTKVGYPFWQQNWFIGLLFLMAIGFFGLALFLFLTFDFDQGSPSSATAFSSSSSASQNVEVTYGTVLKLMHEKTKIRLHSHDVPYGSGSGQQSVTGFPNVDDSNSYWIVRSTPDTSAKQGDTIPNGTIIRLQHMRTRKWLHSHLHASPISGNLEASQLLRRRIRIRYRRLLEDPLRLIIEGSGKTWKQDQRIRLQHVDTGGYLHSHNKKYSRIAGGQQEVCGVREKRADNVWLAAEGVYLPITEST
ncbi:Stromal cell-derived factor 2-like protein [Hibiscus syriacus]|uniref:Stromal cell-derived factor 2-like protein n=1 Tax=Hibiscus syriacus TaxID=106335 RepID=A0A6A3CWS4_HIBSY|nr:Stromal cell-derived factor 2-like protein [Hibiscus syriacus]